MPILSCSAGFSKLLSLVEGSRTDSCQLVELLKKKTKMENKTEILCLSLMKNRGRGGKQQQKRACLRLNPQKCVDLLV